MSFSRHVIDRVIGVEGGYVNDPSDSGGETNWGITKEVALVNGYTGEMRDMPRDVAEGIYRKRYWHALNLDVVAERSPVVADKMFDIAVNLGTRRSGMFLQRWLNVNNNRGQYWPDLVVDGDVGNKTLGALKSYYTKRGDAATINLVKALNCLQGSFYVELAERREKDERFVWGWFNNRVDAVA